MHDRRVERRVDDDRWGDVVVVEIDLSTDGDRPAVEQSREPFGALAVDDATVVRALLRVVAVEVVHRLYDVRDELVLDVGPHQDVVGCSADLAAVDVPAVGDTPGRGLDVGRGVHDGGVLAAELEHRRGEVLGRGLMNDLADLRAPREKDQVPVLFE